MVILISATVIFFKKRRSMVKDEVYDAEFELDDYGGQLVMHAEDKNEILDKEEDINIKEKKDGYQLKSYRGTDIEIAGFESIKDLYALYRDDLPTIDTALLETEIAKQRSNDKKPPTQTKVDPIMFKSGVAAQDSAMAKIIQEIKENYIATGSSSARDNFHHGSHNHSHDENQQPHDKHHEHSKGHGNGGGRCI